ncbi:MAG TPA: HAMP domain-containing sensor histidine kinase [Cyclobacteriaceae bacterium]|nr:HAMP domain-containing sensor histidine kinase [Cyclobacteriaceae bacterium]
MQIRTRLTFQFTVLVTAIVLISFFLVYYLWSQLIEREFDKRLREKGITLAVLLIKVDQIDSTLLTVIDRAKADNLYRENIVVLDSLDRMLFVNTENFELKVDTALFHQVRTQREVRFRQGEFNVLGFMFRDKGNYMVIAGAVNREGQQRLADLRTLLITLFVVMIVFVALAGWVYSGRALRPIQKVMTEVEGISPLDLSKRVADTGQPDEIGKLIAIFNRMLSRVEGAFSLQKTFVANVSHELKNPLTKVTSQLEVTLLNERDNSEYRSTIASVLEDIKDLNQMSNSLLELAQLSRGESSFSMTPIRLDEILWEVRERIETMENYQVNIELRDLPEDESKLYVNGNPHLLKTAFRNVIENACKFSPEKKSQVVLTCHEERLVVAVIDRGPGIGVHDLQRVFEPFFRADATSRTKGYGIGLSLSQRIIALHRGTIEIDSKQGEGTLVRVAFPIAPRIG